MMHQENIASVRQPLAVLSNTKCGRYKLDGELVRPFPKCSYDATDWFMHNVFKKKEKKRTVQGDNLGLLHLTSCKNKLTKHWCAH